MQIMSQSREDYDFFEPLSLGIPEKHHKKDVILDSCFQLYDRILISIA